MFPYKDAGAFWQTDAMSNVKRQTINVKPSHLSSHNEIQKFFK